ncbi:glycosyltransferase family 4 protein [Aureibacillus halotolerans]|uniref:Glycosyltransferase involved in cell wall biosynthesis n=1 Tax=Aureibacillus halotolerans TaxID=1508390 RepID=A0A4R6TXR1_9BACI|nr:glycosyltransferase family 4 protein [Aureibacillus halotolerans]TDQ38678.1 glycosyltransferase involved in cell wall biosynthesis [Aureibacillus halotolerans]
MTKVCFLTSVHNPFDTRVFYKEAVSLRKAGYDVTLICQTPQEETIEGIRLVPLPQPKNRPERMLKTTFVLLQRALKEKADIYHFHDPELIGVGLVLKAKGYHVIYDVHENVAEQMLHKEWLPFKSVFAAGYRQMERLAGRAFPLVLAEDSYEALYPPAWKTWTVRNFPDLTLFPTPPEKKEPYIVYLGGVSQIRGADVTLDALKLLKDAGTPVRFECIGAMSSADETRLRDKVQQYGLQDLVVFHGRMKAKDAYRIVAKAFAGLAVLEPIGNYVNSYPTKMFEYMALQVPVITSNFPLYQDVVNASSCGFVVDPQDPKEIAESIRTLAADPALVKSVGQSGRAAVERSYNWANENETLQQLYRSLQPAHS